MHLCWEAKCEIRGKGCRHVSSTFHVILLFLGLFLNVAGLSVLKLIPYWYMVQVSNPPLPNVLVNMIQCGSNQN